MIVILLLFVFAFAAPVFSPYRYDEQRLEFGSIGMLLPLAESEGAYYYMSPNLKVIRVSPEGKLLFSLPMTKEDGVKKRMEFSDEEKIIVLNYKEKLAVLQDKEGNRLPVTKSRWNTSYLLGTDFLGRDMLTRLMFGARISLIVALIATAVNMTIGIIYGGISGYVGGTVDGIMMRIVDIISTIPLTLYVILIMVILSNGFFSIIVALSSVYWVSMARIVRGQIISLKENEFIYAARTIGSSASYILFHHLLPNAMGPILVTATMLIPSAIFIEAFLGFIGLGIAPPMASLGTMCNDAIQTLRTAPYQLFLPSILICITMFGFSYVGDGLRDALDPKLKG